MVRLGKRGKLGVRHKFRHGEGDIPTSLGSQIIWGQVVSTPGCYWDLPHCECAWAQR